MSEAKSINSTRLKKIKGRDIVLDTNIVIYLMSGKLDIFDELDKARTVSISAITYAEVMAGAKEEDLSELHELLDTFHCLEVTKEVAGLAGMYRQILPKKGLRDLIIAATCQTRGLTLITSDKKDFEGILLKTPIYIDL